MSAANTVIDFYGPVFLTLSGLGLAGIFREQRRIRDLLINLTKSGSDNDKEIVSLKQRLDKVDTTIASVKETVAVLAAEFEHHEEWHERRA